MQAPPAWAGIDRTRAWLTRLLPRLPRVGGDRPSIDSGAALAELAPPRGRG